MKKFNAEYITRTIIYTEGTAVKANLDTMQMETINFRIIGTFSPSDLLPKIKEKYGETVVGFKDANEVQEKRRISIDDFIKYSEKMTKEEEEE